MLDSQAVEIEPIKIKELVNTLETLEGFIEHEFTFSRLETNGEIPKVQDWWETSQKTLSPYLESDDFCGFMINASHPLIGLLEPLTHGFSSSPFLTPSLLLEAKDIALKHWLADAIERQLGQGEKRILIVSDNNGLLSNLLLNSSLIRTEKVSNLLAMGQFVEFADFTNKNFLSDSWKFKSYCYDSIDIDSRNLEFTTVNSQGKMASQPINFTSLIEFQIDDQSRNCRVEVNPDLDIEHFIFSKKNNVDIAKNSHELIEEVSLMGDDYVLAKSSKAMR